MQKLSFLLFAVVLCSNFSAQNVHPIVIKGIDITCAIGQDPKNLVAFSFNNSNWNQIPLQIDEMELKDIVSPYGPYASSYFSIPSGVSELFYSDSTTFIGKDSTNLMFDNDDELVVMWSDLGDRSTLSNNPIGTLNTICCEIFAVHPITNDTNYFYVFLNNGSLNQDAAKNYVDYQFNLLAGSYPTDYDLLSGPNTENTIVSTSVYSMMFYDRWINENLTLKKPSNTVDVFDGHQNFFAPGTCFRTEYTFSLGQGAFATNKNGPIRAIRSYMGANSGPLTQRTNIFYAKKHEVTTYLRVHTIPSVYDVYDYSSQMIGATNYNNLNPSGLNIDGVQDSYNATGEIEWELIEANAGSIIVSHSISGTFTNGVDGTIGYYWNDDSSSSTAGCSGDNIYIGTSGSTISLSAICTDPISSCNASNFRTLASKRDVFYDTIAKGISEAKKTDSIVKIGFTIVSNTCSNTTSIDQLNNSGLRIYPNPFNETLHIEINSPGQLKVLDATGKVVIEEFISNSVKINPNLKKGVYFVLFNNQNWGKLLIKN